MLRMFPGKSYVDEWGLSIYNLSSSDSRLNQYDSLRSTWSGVLAGVGETGRAQSNTTKIDWTTWRNALRDRLKYVVTHYTWNNGHNYNEHLNPQTLLADPMTMQKNDTGLP